ncbi:MAG: hypothetical protein V7742_01790 [Halioglobus sp.]
MIKVIVAVVIGALVSAIGANYYFKSGYESSLNTASVINAAWEIRRVSEALGTDVDTRCHVAEFADSRIEGLMAAADLIADHPSPNTEADIFAIRSVLEATEIFQFNNVVSIAEICRANKGA